MSWAVAAGARLTDPVRVSPLVPVKSRRPPRVSVRFGKMLTGLATDRFPTGSRVLVPLTSSRVVPRAVSLPRARVPALRVNPVNPVVVTRVLAPPVAVTVRAARPTPARAFWKAMVYGPPAGPVTDTFPGWMFGSSSSAAWRTDAGVAVVYGTAGVVNVVPNWLKARVKLVGAVVKVKTADWSTSARK